jgi:hypothetical protein
VTSMMRAWRLRSASALRWTGGFTVEPKLNAA